MPVFDQSGQKYYDIQSQKKDVTEAFWQMREDLKADHPDGMVFIAWNNQDGKRAFPVGLKHNFSSNEGEPTSGHFEFKADSGTNSTWGYEWFVFTSGAFIWPYKGVYVGDHPIDDTAAWRDNNKSLYWSDTFKTKYIPGGSAYVFCFGSPEPASTEVSGNGNGAFDASGAKYEEINKKFKNVDVALNAMKDDVASQYPGAKFFACWNNAKGSKAVDVVGSVLLSGHYEFTANSGTNSTWGYDWIVFRPKPYSVAAAVYLGSAHINASTYMCCTSPDATTDALEGGTVAFGWN